jgi:uncharacterized membrane protein
MALSATAELAPAMTAQSVLDPAREDRTLPMLVYILYLVGLINGLTIVIGLIIAYASKEGAGARTQTHYVFQIRTVWTALAWWIIGGILIFWGIPLSFLLIGIPLVILGGLILAAVHIWFAVRCILGLIFLSQGDAYPRPRTWLV